MLSLVKTAEFFRRRLYQGTIDKKVNNPTQKKYMLHMLLDLEWTGVIDVASDQPQSIVTTQPPKKQPSELTAAANNDAPPADIEMAKA